MTLIPAFRQHLTLAHAGPGATLSCGQCDTFRAAQATSLAEYGDDIAQARTLVRALSWGHATRQLRELDAILRRMGAAACDELGDHDWEEAYRAVPCHGPSVEPTEVRDDQCARCGAISSEVER